LLLPQTLGVRIAWYMTVLGTKIWKLCIVVQAVSERKRSDWEWKLQLCVTVVTVMWLVGHGVYFLSILPGCRSWRNYNRLHRLAGVQPICFCVMFALFLVDCILVFAIYPSFKDLVKLPTILCLLVLDVANLPAGLLAAQFPVLVYLEARRKLECDLLRHYLLHVLAGNTPLLPSLAPLVIAYDGRVDRHLLALERDHTPMVETMETIDIR